ncbi:MAG: EstA family serine hydrolase [Bradyrhizobium sp. PARBB1]|nr:MAG: EstA family serine hydrolase [Bradyrhizobium sp. PARBB1]PSO28794.1 EstA family serine hydrolase [Bradyrhizobium sp. MOS004]HAQ83699.1 EstA family serine hydrolase [Bradyrhizobium sp.]HAR12585.1 EstA family serine hydrolase [Bradyrhizobium sp.]HAR24818.1 EstA family serine hydrolase [Bradyrhizobium sp.]
MAVATIDGFADARFSAAREAFEANFADGEELGASFCATIDGETVVDLWGGFADEACRRPWTRDSIVNVYSITKTMTALTALWLADRGELDFAAPVARYWPEFAANGKVGITVAQLMSHSAGLSGWHPAISGEDFYDWDKATSTLAAQAPLWEPGTASGYHVYTFGFLIGEVIRRITGRTLGTVFREEIASPLNVDFWIGLPASEDHRVADLVPFLPSSAATGVEMTTIQKITFSDTRTDVPSTRTRAWRGAEIPAVNGHGNARSIAAIQTILATGGVANGQRIMSEAGCRRALEVQIDGPDLVMRGISVRFGLGYGLPSPILSLVPPNPNTLFWSGGGGAFVLIDTDARMTFAYAMNRMHRGLVGDARSFRIIRAMWRALGMTP